MALEIYMLIGLIAAWHYGVTWTLASIQEAESTGIDMSTGMHGLIGFSMALLSFFFWPVFFLSSVLCCCSAGEEDAN